MVSEDEMEVSRVTDAAIVGLPIVDPDDDRLTEALARIGEEIVQDRCPPGDERLVVSQSWLLVDTAEEARAWNLPCRCVVCTKAMERAIAALEDRPGMVVALGTLVYDQISGTTAS